jgi:SAM-dependent methyltransferase
MSTRFDEYRQNYGSIVQESIGFSGLKHDFFLRAKAEALDRLMAARGMDASKVKALDIGCGIGTLHRHLEGTFASLDGCDISAESIARAEVENPWVTYRSYREMLPYEDAAFDVAFASCVVHHVPPPHRPFFFSEMRRVLRPGGIAIVIEHNPLNPLTRLAVFRCPFDDDAVLIGSRETAALFRNAGLSDPASAFILLAPLRHRFAQRIEQTVSFLPLGAQYVCSAIA